MSCKLTHIGLVGIVDATPENFDEKSKLESCKWVPPGLAGVTAAEAKSSHSDL